MHNNNHKWLADVKKVLPYYFSNVNVLEIGAMDYNGSARVHFSNCKYVGVDIERGPGVDILADEVSVHIKPHSINTLVMLSVFEHDPAWRNTMALYLPYLRSNALVITCFGAEGNQRHPPEPWAVVPHHEFLDHVATLPLTVIEAFFEEDRYGKECAGCFNCVLAYSG